MATPTPSKFTLATRAPLAAQQFNDFRKELERRRDGTIKPVPVPWPALARSLNGGLWPRTATILAGPTGAGKTSLAVALANHAARSGVPVLYVSLELDGDEMSARHFAIEAGVPWSDLLLGRGPGSLDRATNAAIVATRKKWPLRVTCPTSKLPYQEVGRYVDALRKSYAAQLADAAGGATMPCLVIIDYIQLLDDPDNDDVRTRVGDAGTHLRALAREHHAAMLVISSVARTHYEALSGGKAAGLGRGDPGRFLASAKESGELEYSADNVLVLAVDKSKEPGPDGYPAWVGVAKARWGTPAPWAELRFQYGAFHEPEGLEPLK